MELLEAVEDDTFDKECGKVFLTTKGNIKFICTLCEIREEHKNYVCNNYKEYVSHLSEVHFKLTGSLNESYASLIPDIEIKEADEEEQKEKIVKVETDALENDILKEEELPIDTLLEKSEESRELLSEFENILSPKENMNIEIPIFSRKVRKRTPKTAISKSGKKIKPKKPPKEKNIIVNCAECRSTSKATSDERMSLHTCKRSFICYHCGRSYLRNSHLNRHLKRHKNQRDYKCQICDKAFYDSTTLRSHMIGHTNERPFKCPQCPATFSRNTALQNHMKLHENKREYKCHLCGMAFNQQAGLCTHMKVTHKTA